jgi:hypothetical protein
MKIKIQEFTAFWRLGVSSGKKASALWGLDITDFDLAFTT